MALIALICAVIFTTTQGMSKKTLQIIGCISAGSYFIWHYYLKEKLAAVKKEQMMEEEKWDYLKQVFHRPGSRVMSKEAHIRHQETKQKTWSEEYERKRILEEKCQINLCNKEYETWMYYFGLEKKESSYKSRYNQCTASNDYKRCIDSCVELLEQESKIKGK